MQPYQSNPSEPQVPAPGVAPELHVSNMRINESIGQRRLEASFQVYDYRQWTANPQAENTEQHFLWLTNTQTTLLQSEVNDDKAIGLPPADHDGKFILDMTLAHLQSTTPVMPAIDYLLENDPTSFSIKGDEASGDNISDSWLLLPSLLAQVLLGACFTLSAICISWGRYSYLCAFRPQSVALAEDEERATFLARNSEERSPF